MTTKICPPKFSAEIFPKFSAELSEQLKEVVGQMENRSRQEERGRGSHPPGSTDIASVLAIFGGLLLVLTLWAFIKHFLATSQR